MLPIKTVVNFTASTTTGFLLTGDTSNVSFANTGTTTILPSPYSGTTPHDVDQTIDHEIYFDLHEFLPEILTIPNEEARIKFKHIHFAVFNKSQGAFRIPKWGIEFHSLTSADIQHAVIHKYRQLENKARNDRLTKNDRKFWKQLLADTDYGYYCQWNAAAVNDIGTRIRKTKDGIEVEWSGGDRETITGKLAEMLSDIKDGEDFSARVKFIDFKLHSISDVESLEAVEPIDIDSLFCKS